MKYNFISIILILNGFCLQAQDNSNYDYLGLITLDNTSYRFRIQSDSKTFKMKICKNKNDCSDPYDYKKTMDSDDFLIAVIAQINTEHNPVTDYTLADFVTSGNDKKVKVFLEEVKAYDEAKAREKLTEAQNVLRDIDNAVDQYAGELVLHKTIKNLNIKKPRKSIIKDYYMHLYEENKNKPDEFILKNNDLCSHENDSLELIDATLIFFNNKASTIAVNAILHCVNGEKENLEFYNSRYSIPIRAFTYYKGPSTTINRLGLRLSAFELKADTKTGHEIIVHVNDMFDYRSFGNGNIGNFGYSIANQRLHISNNVKDSNPKKVVQRRFFDFFTGVIYSDLMGINTNTSNSLINAQASLLLPMNLGNWSEVTALRQFKVNVNVALNNSFENEERYIGFKDLEKVNHFDLYRKQNLGGMLSLDMFSYESKGWFLTWSLGYNFGFYRTGYQYTKTIDNASDEVSNGQLLSITHGPYINFEFRPQESFGADIMISLDELNINDDDVVDDMSFRDDILINDNSNSFLAKHNIVNVSANFYWLTNPGKSDGGVYAKLGLSYHTPTEASFPQLMVGYATNLTSFVNRFKVKDKDSKP